MTSSLEGEGGRGVWIPPKSDDVIYEQPLTIQDNVRALDNELNCPMVCANVAGGPQARVAVFAKDTRDSSDH